MQLFRALAQRPGIRYVQRLAEEARQRWRIGKITPRGDDALHIVLVATGNQSLAQQRLAGASRTDHHLHLLGEMRHVVQLCQHRLALGCEEAKSRRAPSERVMLQLVMTEKILCCAQVAHIFFRLINHRPATARTACRACLSKSAVTTASPRRLSSTRRNCPSSTFLSTAMRRVKSSAHISAGAVTGSPAAAINSMQRSSSSAASQPSVRDSCNAMTMPAPTASPCSQAP